MGATVTTAAPGAAAGYTACARPILGAASPPLDAPTLHQLDERRRRWWRLKTAAATAKASTARGAAALSFLSFFNFILRACSELLWLLKTSHIQLLLLASNST